MKNGGLHTSLRFSTYTDKHHGLDLFQDDGLNSTLPLPECFEGGCLRMLFVGESIDYMITRHGPLREPVKVEARNTGRLKLIYLLETGPTTFRCEGIRGDIPGSKGRLYALSASAHIQFDDPAGHELHSICLFIEPARMAEVFEHAGLRSDERVKRLLDEPGGEPGLFGATISTASLADLCRIENCRYRGAIQRVYLEGKSLELIGQALHAFSRPGDETGRARDFGRRDLAGMRSALDILDARIADPPSLSELARTLGISLAKLKRDFKRAHGRNVHEYLIERRLDEAERLLAEGGLSVKEAAFQVGYRNQSHFAQVFRRRYGRCPRDFKS